MGDLNYILGQFEAITTAFEGLVEAVKNGSATEDNADLLDYVITPMIDNANATIEKQKRNQNGDSKMTEQKKSAYSLVSDWDFLGSITRDRGNLYVEKIDGIYLLRIVYLNKHGVLTNEPTKIFDNLPALKDYVLLFIDVCDNKQTWNIYFDLEIQRAYRAANKD